MITNNIFLRQAAWRKRDIDYPRNWPNHGNIKFNNYATRYRYGLDLVLKEITCNIKAGEKVTYCYIFYF